MGIPKHHFTPDDLSRLNFAADDLFLNTGAFSGLTCCLQALCDRGTEVIYLSPPWFYYRSMIESVGAIPKGVDLEPPDWRIPLEAIAFFAKKRIALGFGNHNNVGQSHIN